jgi:hypothetical protein
MGRGGEVRQYLGGMSPAKARKYSLVSELGRVSDLVVIPSGRRIFAFFCSPHNHRAQNSGCGSQRSRPAARLLQGRRIKRLPFLTLANVGTRPLG